MMRSLLAAVLLVASASAYMRASNLVAPSSWTMLGEAHPNDKATVALYLRQRNLEQLEERFWTLSNPDSEEYTQWMTNDEVLDMIAPSAADQERVVTWLKDSGANLIDNRRDVVEFTAPVHKVEEMFKTTLRRFTNEENGREIVRATGSYAVPNQLEDVIDMVRGLADFPMHRGGVKVWSAENAQAANGIIEPSVIKAQYNIPADITVQNPTKATQGPAEFDGGQIGSYGKTDLATFAQENAYSNPTVKIVGPYFPNAPEPDESNLDIQFITGVAQDTNNFFWTAKSGFMLELANELSSATDRPMVVSVSWGANEAEISGDGLSPIDYVRRTDTELQKLGVQGLTILVATGDNGASAGQCGSLNPDYPATSPYVTAVGATMLQGAGSSGSSGSSTFAVNPDAEAPICQNPPLGTPCATPGQEIVCSYPTALITSGGGFSGFVPMPAYQSKVVNAYLQNGGSALPPSSMFNSTNRGYPDVSAFGHAYVIHNQGSWVQVDGTSCSTPVTAAFVTLLNDARVTAGKATLGPINQMLYGAYDKDSSIFNDITSGNNKCHEGGCCQEGYGATTGWDAATGLGSINYGKLATYVSNL